MGKFVADLALTGVLAFLALLLCGCSIPPGLRISAGVTGSPLGVVFTVEQAATFEPTTPESWTTTQPTLTTQPAPAP